MAVDVVQSLHRQAQRYHCLTPFTVQTWPLLKAFLAFATTFIFMGKNGNKDQAVKGEQLESDIYLCKYKRSIPTVKKMNTL